jgi:hypothetical protein
VRKSEIPKLSKIFYEKNEGKNFVYESNLNFNEIEKKLFS